MMLDVAAFARTRGGRKATRVLANAATDRYVFAFSLCTLCLCGEFFPLRAADWPQFLGPDRNGISSETGLLASWPKKGPPTLWEKSIGEGYSGPVVADNKLILFHRIDNQEVVECLDAKTGKGVWKFGYATDYEDGFGKGNGPRATPLIAGDRVFTLGAQGQLHCLDLRTGKKLWAHFLAKEYQLPDNFFGIGTSPILESDRLLVNVGPAKEGVLAFHIESGKELWRAKCDPASYSSPVAATIDGVRHVLFFTMNGLVSIDPETGEIRFRKPWRSRIAASVTAASPIVVRDQVFVSASYGTGAVLLRVGKSEVEEIWKGDEIISNHYNTCIYKDGFLYGCDGRQEAGPSLRCVEFATGKVHWTQEGFGCATMILADGRLIALTENGDLVLLDPSRKAFKELARIHVLSKFCRAQIALADGLLYARDDHKLICWNLKK